LVTVILTIILSRKKLQAILASEC